MGQKVNPHGLRVGVIKDWDSRWYAEKEFADFLVEDHEIREFLKKKLYSAGISKIEIERASDRVKVIIFTAKPGVIIGKGGQDIEKLKADLSKLTDKKLVVDIKEVKRPDREAQLVAENIAQQLENRVSFRRAMKSTMGRTLKAGALGILTYNPRYASSLIKKLLESAIANAENNNGMNRDNLYIAECYANKGPTMKRVQPRAQGRAYRIEKRMSHITVVLDEK